ncbi:double-stranded RNA-binding protein 3 isoform X1 [Hevea brasiliensis]|nr:double-stranded RNA-binding protein 3 isoform X1 [Hevea brasiliensis]XP_058004657.1 double-stranded RNA-binding protein 3 isoform X1 [Hevea brasiliensis]
MGVFFLVADMFKNQLQELAQRSCFNLPSYTCIREGPDHAPRFKASVNFNGEIFESPSYCTTLRQAEHAAAEVAFNVLSSRGPSRSLTARVLDETGIYKNLLQETAHRAGLNLPVYTTVRSGPGHVPTFTCTVELAGMKFTGESAKTKKQAEKNAAIAAWSALKRMPNLEFLANKELESREEQDQAVLARVLSNFRSKDEYKQRKRDHGQARRRMVRGCRDINNSASSSASTTNNSLQLQHWKLLDLLLDSALDSSIEKQRSFVSLLPPPPPRTTSKILPPTSHGDDPALYQSIRGIHQTQVKGKQEVKMQEIPVPVEEHQKDEEEWLGAIKKPIEKDSTGFMYRPFPRSNPGKLGATQQKSSHISTKRMFGSPIASTSSRIHIANPLYTGVSHAHRIAPAVHIRSVIPVCAAPPPVVRPQSASVFSTGSSPSTSSKSKQTGGAPAAELAVVNKTQSQPTQLSSAFNKKLQL